MQSIISLLGINFASFLSDAEIGNYNFTRIDSMPPDLLQEIS